MFIYNIKMSSGWFKKFIIICIILIMVGVFTFVGYRFVDATSKVMVNDSIDANQLEITADNYTSILKDCHDNIDNYVGKKIKFTGFIYRLYDFNENQFVLAREMIISSNNEAVIVGFLCDCDDLSSFSNGAWVEVDGVIEKGSYHGDIPIIKIDHINNTSVPEDEYVYPPDSGYIPTEL